MHCDGFRRWLAQAAKLTAQQRSEAAHLLAQAAAMANGADVVNQRAADVSACPHCYSARLSRWGKEAGLQRYRCGACRKTFNATTASNVEMPGWPMRRPWWTG